MAIAAAHLSDLAPGPLVVSKIIIVLIIQTIAFVIQNRYIKTAPDVINVFHNEYTLTNNTVLLGIGFLFLLGQNNSLLYRYHTTFAKNCSLIFKYSFCNY